ncbi:hypothetical protein Taro_027784 [Colocasia esculenta]|uniref:Receptor-like serine/threonine-protein kinase n=1 Tax=Colocasia esculenta TaxID=4460 RepID=A0A843VNH4_COLES|nr:hypothetical protein [Colocasia esculenta]
MAVVLLQRVAGTALSLLVLLLGVNPPFLTRAHPSHVISDSISLGRPLSGNQTIVSRGSRFELGFFTPGNSHYYIGIWYKNIPVQTVIWVANREAPLSSAESSELKLSHDGNLILVNPSKNLVWSSNATSLKSNSTIAILLDTGNLVLKKSHVSQALLWQSFDHPTDTWVPGQRVGVNKITGEYQVLTSWKNSRDPAPGLFTRRLAPRGSGNYISLWNGSVEYDHTGEWNGHSFEFLPQTTLNQNFKFSFVETRERKYINCTMSNTSTLLRLVLDFTGQLKGFTWLNDSQKWMLIWSRPAAQCDVYSICGAFGVCDQKSVPLCSCLRGFDPEFSGGWGLGDWSGGCVRRSALQCADNSSSVTSRQAPDVFSVIPDVKLPTDSQSLLAAGAEECKLACSHDCGCSAYSYHGSTCLTWNGQLLNLRQLSSGADGPVGTLHLRLAASEQQEYSHTDKSKILSLAITGSILGFLILSSITLLAIKSRCSSAMGETVEGSLTLFNYSELQQITNKFSTLLGRGGFGSVFAGMLPDSAPVAVKKLQGLRQGEKQFRAEVMTLGKVQHANLVRLRGFCAEGDKRLLVYDYMPRGSLDSHLFNGEAPCLDWRTRYEVALGTARALAYLHEQCRERIIHCDIKPENILLDDSYHPKVADFGMAKLVARDLSRVLTTMRGTIGYLAPEWITGLPITPKADVYSFGMVLFELVSGRRNTMMVGDGGAAASYFPLLAALEINGGGDVLRLLDHRLWGDADVKELTRACMAACWCVQEDESCRPTMGEVVRILEGVLVAGRLPPIPRSLQYLVESGDGSLSENR